MNDPYLPPPRSRPLRAVVIAMVIAFVAGLAAMGWALTHWLPMPKSDAPNSAETVAETAPPSSTTTRPSAPPATTATPSPPPATDPNATSLPPSPPSLTDARVGALEARLAEIDRHATASADQASRAEGLLIAFAARRAVDSGVVLGYLEGELNNHFGSAQPRAVANIIAASRAPVTLESLRIGLDNVVPEADPNSTNANWWTRFRTNFGNLITIRRAGEKTTAPGERLMRARLAINSGAVQNALAEVARLPGGAATNAWMTNARRYIEAHNALDILEAAALTRPQPAKPSAATPKPAPTAAAPAGSASAGAAGTI